MLQIPIVAQFFLTFTMAIHKKYKSNWQKYKKEFSKSKGTVFVLEAVRPIPVNYRHVARLRTSRMHFCSSRCLPLATPTKCEKASR